MLLTPLTGMIAHQHTPTHTPTHPPTHPQTHERARAHTHTQTRHPKKRATALIFRLFKRKDIANQTNYRPMFPLHIKCETVASQQLAKLAENDCTLTDMAA